jgi:nucleotide-binding universal stress UspA family protein
VSLVVVAVDGSAGANAALDEAIELARATGDRLLLVSVWRPLRGDFGIGFPPSVVTADLLEGDRPRAEDALSDAAERVRSTSLDLETELVTGDPAAEVCRVAAERGARLIAMGSHGHGRLARVLLGSVSTQVLHDAPCPVLVVRRPDDGGGDGERQDAA